jgi:hypothetical protein
MASLDPGIQPTFQGEDLRVAFFDERCRLEYQFYP